MRLFNQWLANQSAGRKPKGQIMKNKNFFFEFQNLLSKSGMSLYSFLKSKNVLQRYSKTYIRRMFKDCFMTRSAYQEMLIAFPELKNTSEPAFTVRELPLRVGARRVKGKYQYKKDRKFGSMKGEIVLETGKSIRSDSASSSDRSSLNRIYSAVASIPKKHRKTAKNLAKITDRAILKSHDDAIHSEATTAREAFLMIAAEIGLEKAMTILSIERNKILNIISRIN
jgi:hypothetical protein